MQIILPRLERRGVEPSTANRRRRPLFTPKNTQGGVKDSLN